MREQATRIPYIAGLLEGKTLHGTVSTLLFIHIRDRFSHEQNQKCSEFPFRTFILSLLHSITPAGLTVSWR